MTAVVRGDALRLPLRDRSVNLIVTSPPYFALRSYRDGGDHYDGQIGSEPTPQAFLEALWAVTKECWRVLADDGSMFVNLGDKRSGSGGHNNSNLGVGASKASGSTLQGGKQFSHREVAREKVPTATRRNAPDRYNQAAFGRPKSKMLLPHRYAIGCEDGLADPDGVGWIVRSDMVWSKPNGLPESVTDRVRDSHEYWFHLTKQGRYFAAVDEVREPQRDPDRSGPDSGSKRRVNAGENGGFGLSGDFVRDYNPLGKLPGSVWTVPSEPLTVPDWVGVDHFAAFPQEWPRRLILGWSPSGICTACGQGRRPVCDVSYEPAAARGGDGSINRNRPERMDAVSSMKTQPVLDKHTTITGYACACADEMHHMDCGIAGGWPHQASDHRDFALPPTRPAVVLDPFGGTGTVAMVARTLGRTGINIDLSADYCRLAQWRIFSSGHAAKTRARTWREAQRAML